VILCWGASSAEHVYNNRTRMCSNLCMVVHIIMCHLKKKMRTICGRSGSKDNNVGHSIFLQSMPTNLFYLLLPKTM